MQVEDYSLGQCIGKGAFGEVYLTTKKGINKLFARSSKLQKKKIEKDKLFSLDDEIKEKFKNFLKDKQKNKIQEIIILENQNIITLENYIKISYYEKDKLNYKKVFNNLNKYYFIFELCKLQSNRFCFISNLDQEHIHFYALNCDDFASKEKEIKMKKPISNIKNKNIFPISNDKVIIISKYEFYIFNINILEIQTIYDVGLICSVLPFSMKKDDMNCNYEFFAIIFWENKKFFMKIYHVDSEQYIKESEKIDLCKYSKYFKQYIMSEKDIINYFTEENNKTISYKQEYYNVCHYDYRNYSYTFNFEKNFRGEEVFIYISYNLFNQNDVNFQIHFLIPYTSTIYNKISIPLKTIQLNNIIFK